MTILAFLSLLHLLTASASALMVKDSMVAATGSSIRFPGTDKEFAHFGWEFSNPRKTVPIMEYTITYQIIFDQYKNRVEFNKSDGSLLLKDLHEGDTGKYKLTVELDPQRTRILTLEVFDPLSTPSIFSKISLENHTVELSCVVQRGRASSVLWSREEVALPADQRYWLSDDNTTLIISNARKSDSGPYTCTVANPVNRTDNTYQLSIKGDESNFRVRNGLIPFAVLVVVMLLSVLVYAPCIGNDGDAGHKIKHKLGTISHPTQLLHSTLTRKICLIGYKALS